MSQKKTHLAEPSTLMKIASDAATPALSVDQALANIPPIHLPAIPIGVVNALVTCIATVSKSKKRRCLRPRVPGSDYCSCHKDPENPVPSKQRLKKPKQRDESLKRKCRESDNEKSPRQHKKRRKKLLLQGCS